jgi:hypothetical protein
MSPKHTLESGLDPLHKTAKSNGFFSEMLIDSNQTFFPNVATTGLNDSESASTGRSSVNI